MRTDVAGLGRMQSRIQRLAQRIADLRGAKRQALAIALGAGATLALPPLYALPLLFVAFTGLVWLLSPALSARTAFLTGWSFGMGYFVSSLYWIGFAPFTYSRSLLWVVPFATVGVPIILSVFHGLACAVACRLGRAPLERALALAIAWGVTEWLRGHVLTGFPWNLAGYGWTGSTAMAQSAALVGMYGVTFLAVLAAATPAGLAESSARRRGVAVALAIALPLAAWTGGTVRLMRAPPLASESVAAVGIRLVQPNIPQREKWMRVLQRRNFDLFRSLSIADRPDWITHVVWPETAATFDLAASDNGRRSAAAVVPTGGLLITGAPRRASDPARIWNSLVAISETGAVAGTFDKFHLVPFGEYMPFRTILPLDKITPGTLDFSAGPGPQTLYLKGLPPVSPLICYEVIFPGTVVDARDRPAWLLNLTNDAWYGETAGPHQHLAIARLRAIEEGMPLVRSANTGISAVVDAYGREVGRLDLGVAGVLDFRLPKSLGETAYARFGDYLFTLLVLTFLLPLLLLRRN